VIADLAIGLVAVVYLLLVVAWALGPRSVRKW